MSNDIVKALLESLTEEQKASLVSGLMKELATETPTEKTEETVSSEPRVKEDFTVVRNEDDLQRKSPVKFKKNNWVDTGEDRDLDIDYSELEKRKTPRKRAKPNKQQVECHICGKSFSVNSNLVYGEFHRCNRCTGR